jgi:hypothetical protein
MGIVFQRVLLSSQMLGKASLVQSGMSERKIEVMSAQGDASRRDCIP